MASISLTAKQGGVGPAWPRGPGDVPVGLACQPACPLQRVSFRTASLGATQRDIELLPPDAAEAGSRARDVCTSRSVES